MKHAVRRARWRLLLPALLIAFLTTVTASAAGSGGWDHLGTGGAANTASLNGAVYALINDGSGNIYAAGAFTKAGPRPAPHLAAWISGDHQWLGSGELPTSWSSHPLNGDIHAMVWDGTGARLFVGGTFTNADGDPGADFLAVWDQNRWKPFCSPAPAFGGNVSSLQIIGSTLYVGGAFQNGAGIPGANYLIACDLSTGVARAVGKPGDLNGGVYALTADAGGTLYVGGQFSNVANTPAADHVASYDGAWHPLGLGAPTTYAASPRAATTSTSGRTPSTSPGSRRPTMSRAGTARPGAPSARTRPARTDGSRKPPSSTQSPPRAPRSS